MWQLWHLAGGGGNAAPVARWRDYFAADALPGVWAYAAGVWSAAVDLVRAVFGGASGGAALLAVMKVAVRKITPVVLTRTNFWYNLDKMNPVIKRIVTALTTAAVVVCAIIYAPTTWFRPVFFLLACVCLCEYQQLLGRKMRLVSVKGIAAMFAGALFLFAMLAVPPTVAERHGNLMMLYLIAIVKFSDMGGFAFGLGSKKLFGDNHKLCPSISPGKSWEGLGGSVLASILMSLAFLPITHFAVPKALAFGVVAALVGTAGDLVESKFKRWVGVKDSATFMPAGLGGFLDMIDSLLLAPAVLAPFL